MYEAFFQLQRRPFSTTPDASCFYAADSIQESLAELMHRIEHGQGIGILTAPAGTGKTLLFRRLAAQLQGRYTTAFLGTARFSTRRALLQAILYELGQRYTGLDEQELRLELVSALRQLAVAGRGGLLIVDEAHLLSDRLLEEVRAAADLSDKGQPLLRVVLSGQSSLEERLTTPEFEALNQRVACHVFLEPYTRQQTLEYISYRLAWGGRNVNQIFNDDALARIARACNGLPRCINQLCDHCLLLAFVAESPHVTLELVDEALVDLKQLPLHWSDSLESALATETHPDHAEFETGTNTRDPEAGFVSRRFDEEATVEQPSWGRIAAAGAELSGEAASFEIGGDEPIWSSREELPDNADEHLAAHPELSRLDGIERGVVPVISWPSWPTATQLQPSAAQPAAHFFDEEVVVDRYARLASGESSVPVAQGIKVDEQQFSSERFASSAPACMSQNSLQDDGASPNDGDEVSDGIANGWSKAAIAPAPADESNNSGVEDILRGARDEFDAPLEQNLVQTAQDFDLSNDLHSTAAAETLAGEPFVYEEVGIWQREAAAQCAPELADWTAEVSLDGWVPTHTDLEMQIGEDVAELCRDVQESILDRLEPAGDEPGAFADGGSPNDFAAELSQPDSATSEYDVIEPEAYPQLRNATHFTRPEPSEPRRAVSGRRTSYKQLFSQLRRKQSPGSELQ